MLNKNQYFRLSKKLSHALRHDPDRYGLILDKQGWVELSDLIAVLRKERTQWAAIEQSDIEAMMAAASKQRYQITGSRIRAQYGHSIATRIEKQITPPPEILYHGTSPRAATAIIREGLRPMRRQYVHLSADQATAIIVGSRHAKPPVLLIIDAAKAFAAGVNFYTEPNGIWLADEISAEFIKIG